MDSIILGNRFRDIRIKNKMSMKDVAEFLGTNIPMIQRIESGKEYSNNVLISALSFYSRYVKLENLLSDDYNMVLEETMAEVTPDAEVYNTRNRIIYEKQISVLKQIEEMLQKNREQLEIQMNAVTK